MLHTKSRGIQPEGKDVANQKIQGLTPIKIRISRRLLSVRIIERLGIAKINARLHQRIKR